MEKYEAPVLEVLDTGEDVIVTSDTLTPAPSTNPGTPIYTLS